MEEQYEILALRLARIVLAKSSYGQLHNARKIARELLEHCEPIETQPLASYSISASIPSTESCHIRWMIRRDMPEVLAVENCSFEFPWRESDFIRCLRQRDHIGMVAEINKQVVGFMIYQLHKDHLDLLNFAVDPMSRRRRVGETMVQKMIRKLTPRRRTRITLYVRESNVSAQLFFRTQGFVATGIVYGTFDDTNEAAYAMEYSLVKSAT
jgi:[ribosomal protein S18]-alanine N-acetyltransferase